MICIYITTTAIIAPQLTNKRYYVTNNPIFARQGFWRIKGILFISEIGTPKTPPPSGARIHGVVCPTLKLSHEQQFRNRSINLPCNLKIHTPNHHISIDLPFPRLQIFDLLPFPESNPIWKKPVALSPSSRACRKWMSCHAC